MWPSWRFEHRLDEEETQENLKRIAEAKEEATHALEVSQEQVAEVRRIAREHKPIREKLRDLREVNGFTEGFKRIIEEGSR